MHIRQFPSTTSSVLLLILVFADGLLGYDENVCVPPTDTCGPIAPSPPKSYVTHLEEVDQLSKTTSYVNEFYDPHSQVMAVLRTTRGMSDHAIFFYETDTAVIIQYREGAVDGRPHFDCLVAEIEDAGALAGRVRQQRHLRLHAVALGGSLSSAGTTSTASWTTTLYDRSRATDGTRA
ncbi:hypothetical protein C7M84_012046 [Penaeus vannamei]|uniref:Uncharacterized protein n=1 Tax=Penaeus vannamei TaxID=6689 RepID=A0A423SZR7_PENVA|nr:hypothetical protein C7M84_012046 [Penaeus vannamei]